MGNGDFFGARAAIRLKFAGVVVPALVASACIFGVNSTPGGGGSSEAETGPTDAADTAIDARDAVDTETVDAPDLGDADEDPDGGRDVDVDGGVATCSYQGSDVGVCADGVPGGAAPEADGGDGGADAGAACGPPERFESEEQTCDELDNDCDGVVDEGCPCDATGTSEGVCSNGTKLDSGRCEPPEDYLPDEAVCDSKDNDCDGAVDEGCSCLYMSTSEGVCAQATKDDEGTCEKPEGYESDESSCDSKDNDCDGEVDEGCTCVPGTTESCYTGPTGTAGTGICEEGTRTCQSDDSWGPCDDETTPEMSESCDGVDDNCDGVVDEGCDCNYTGTSDGVCSGGTIGSSGNCNAPNGYEQDESSCDGVDNDCDGIADENCPCNYDNQSAGVCGNATIDATSGACAEPSDYESDESSCDGVDNDCDGTVDEGCTCTPGTTESCYTGASDTEGVGVCSSGTRKCQSDGTWGDCTGETTPSSETCDDGADNDCDGTVDDGCPCNYNGSSEGVCGGQTIGSDGDCREPSNYESTEQTCYDGEDNDCDGDSDCADSSCGGRTCGKGNGGAECSGDCVETNCHDGVDNDNDSKTDCADPNCAGVVCGTGNGGAECHSGNCVETKCGDGNDNDDDGAVDDADAEDCRRNGLEWCADDKQCISTRCVSSSSQCAQVIAVTSTSYDGDLGGLSGADNKCDSVMNGALPGNWRAVVSTDAVDAKSHVVVQSKIYNTHGDKVADGAADLWDGTLDGRVRYDESGRSVSVPVWTGTKSDGTVVGACGVQSHCTCGDWSSSSGTNSGTYGRSDRKTTDWVDSANAACGDIDIATPHLYCIDGQ